MMEQQIQTVEGFISKVVKSAIKANKLDKNGLKALQEREDEFTRHVIVGISKCSVKQDFANENTTSNNGYRSGYRTPSQISDQIDTLRRHWPNLNPDPVIRYFREVYPNIELPKWVEGPFINIRPGYFSKHPHEELEEILKMLAKSRDGKFINHLAGELNENNYRLYHKTKAALSRIMEVQKGSDLIVVPAQLGLRGGKPPFITSSVRRARVKFQKTEFGLTAESVGTILIGCRNRLGNRKDLFVDCVGSELPDCWSFSWSYAPAFYYVDGLLRFHTRGVDNVDSSYAPVSGFVFPQ